MNFVTQSFYWKNSAPLVPFVLVLIPLAVIDGKVKFCGGRRGLKTDYASAIRLCKACHAVRFDALLISSSLVMYLYVRVSQDPEGNLLDGLFQREPYVTG